jgi:hypothetical protein
MKKIFYYSVSVKYNEGYFDNPNTPLDVILGFSSTQEKTKKSIQKLMNNAVVLDITEITADEFLKF